MAKGKKTCKILKDIRKQIAAENDIELITSECTYKGDCLGTCPRCEAEVRYLERELEKRQRLGKVAMIAGVSLGTMLSATSCDSTEQMTKEPLAGDVVAVTADPPQPIPDTTEVLPPLMGIVRMLRMEYAFDKDTYEKMMKDRFVFPGMEQLSVVGGKLYYEHIGDGTECNTFEKLVEATKEFTAPSYPGGEQKMLKDIAEGLKDKPIYGQYKGVMEVAFTVTPMGNVDEVMIEKSLDLNLDAAVISIFQGMRWEPARYELKDENGSLFECRCVQKILFPLD
jgi:hypothetical protein